MRKTIRKATTTETRGEAAPPGRTLHADTALQPSTALESMVIRALDQELEWYFVYAEAALVRNRVDILPTYAAASILTSNPNEHALQGKARELAGIIQSCLRMITDRHAAILRAIYTPRRWPKNIETTFQTLAPIVVRLAVAAEPWPTRSAHAGLEDAAATRLSARLVARTAKAAARMKREASRLFRSAIIAYTKVRALEAPPLGLS